LRTVDVSRKEPVAVVFRTIPGLVLTASSATPAEMSTVRVAFSVRAHAALFVRTNAAARARLLFFVDVLRSVVVARFALEGLLGGLQIQIQE
jgi:hypothetical protein